MSGTSQLYDSMIPAIFSGSLLLPSWFPSRVESVHWYIFSIFLQCLCLCVPLFSKLIIYFFDFHWSKYRVIRNTQTTNPNPQLVFSWFLVHTIKNALIECPTHYPTKCPSRTHFINLLLGQDWHFMYWALLWLGIDNWLAFYKGFAGLISILKVSEGLEWHAVHFTLHYISWFGRSLAIFPEHRFRGNSISTWLDRANALRKFETSSLSAIVRKHRLCYFHPSLWLFTSEKCPAIWNPIVLQLWTNSEPFSHIRKINVWFASLHLHVRRSTIYPGYNLSETYNKHDRFGSSGWVFRPTGSVALARSACWRNNQKLRDGPSLGVPSSTESQGPARVRRWNGYDIFSNTIRGAGTEKIFGNSRF